MTETQAKLLRWLWERRHTPVSPSYEEMRDAMGLASKSGTHRVISALVEHGYVRRLPRMERSVEVTEKAAAVMGPEPQVHTMWGSETDNLAQPGTRIVQPLSLCFFKSQLPQRLATDPATNPHPVKVRVSIERID